MVFKVSSGNYLSVYDLWVNESCSGDMGDCDMAPGSVCEEPYKSSRVDAWQDISQVRMA